MADFEKLLGALHSEHAAFIIVGGVAATIHGSARLTSDLDIVYERTPENYARIVHALSPLQPYLRRLPPGLPFQFDSETLRNGLNFTLTTTAGPIDLLGEIAGSGTFESLIGQTVRVTIFGLDLLALDLEALIRAKRAAGRPRISRPLPNSKRSATSKGENPEAGQLGPTQHVGDIPLSRSRLPRPRSPRTGSNKTPRVIAVSRRDS